MNGRKRFLLVIVALACCVAGVLVDLALAGTTNWTVVTVGAALLPLAAFSYHRMRAERRLAAIAATKRN